MGARWSNVFSLVFSVIHSKKKSAEVITTVAPTTTEAVTDNAATDDEVDDDWLRRRLIINPSMYLNLEESLTNLVVQPTTTRPPTTRPPTTRPPTMKWTTIGRTKGLTNLVVISHHFRTTICEAQDIRLDVELIELFRKSTFEGHCHFPHPVRHRVPTTGH